MLRILEKPKSIQLKTCKVLQAMRIILIVCVLTIVGCDSQVSTEIKIPFSIAPLEKSVEIDDLRFFIHDVFLLDPMGNKLDLHFDEEQASADGVVLVDLRKNSNRHYLSGWVQSKADSYSGIEFIVGVPFLLNHSDPLTAPAPLDDISMFWVWRDGYKFFRLDYQTETSKPSYHLGSTGCQSASPVRPPEHLCDQTNEITISLTGFDPLTEGIKVNLNPLIALMESVDNQSCTGNYAEDKGCIEAFSEFGLNIQTGKCIDNCKNQTLFE